ncbi:MAG: hypothetical protein IT343_16705 [Candidatus Melainabacteria bacterium]|jgi:hypothetical protein|nr:hypothetical protein [Candidatus Melainabacteria bacterium]
MKKFNVSLLSLAAVAFVGTSLLPAVAGEGCCGGKKEKAQAEDCCKDKAKAEAKSDAKAAADAATTADASKATETAKPTK